MLPKIWKQVAITLSFAESFKEVAITSLLCFKLPPPFPCIGPAEELTAPSRSLRLIPWRHHQLCPISPAINRPLAAFSLAQHLLSSVKTLPVKAGPGYHSLKISRPPTGSPPFFSVIICLFVLVFTFDMLSTAIRASPSADGLDERSSFDLPKPACPFLPDKDTEGYTGMGVQYLPVCLGQMFDAVTAPSYTGRIFGSWICRGLRPLFCPGSVL